VRQALAILSAERLVSAHPSRGYYVAFWSERDLKALYQWRGQLAVLAAESFEASPSDAKPKGSVLEIYHALMRGLERAANDEVKRAAQNADERLSAAHLAETDEIADLVEELRRLEVAIKSGERARIKRALQTYFRRRIEAAPSIRARASIAALPRNGDG
jgi:DNA-binding FadR family transcriptional regulator